MKQMAEQITSDQIPKARK